MSEACVKTLKRDYVRVTPLPDAATVLGLVPAWIDDCNTLHPHSALARRVQTSAQQKSGCPVKPRAI